MNARAAQAIARRTRPETHANPFQQSEAGVIPADWISARLGPLVQITSGESPSRFRFSGEGMPYFKVEQLNLGNKFLSETPYYIKSNRCVAKGSLIFPKRGASILLNKIRILANDSFFDTNLMALTPGHEVDAMYLYYALTHIELWRIADVTSIPQINNKHIIPLRIPLPTSRREQLLIAEALSDADAVIESLEQLIAKKCAIKQGAMQELLTGKRRLPGFKGEWQSNSLGELFYFSGGLSASRDQLGSNGHYYLHYGDIHAAETTYIDVDRDNGGIPRLDVPIERVNRVSLLADGDVVFVDASEDDEGASKHIVVYNASGRPFISGLHTIVAKPRSTNLDNHFKRYGFQSQAIKSQFKFYAVGTKVTGVSKSNIAKIRLSYPDLKEQAAIAKILGDIDGQLGGLGIKLAKARQVKQGMMQELLTGRVRLI